MTTIHIAASREYEVVIEPGLQTRLGTMAAELGLGRRAAVISDDAVFALYGAAAEKALTDAGFQVDHFLFPHGEQQKNLSTFCQPALKTSHTHHNIIVKLCIPCSQDHFKIFDGIVPHFNIVRYGVLKQDNVLIYNSQGTGKHIPVYL